MSTVPQSGKKYFKNREQESAYRQEEWLRQAQDLIARCKQIHHPGCAEASTLQSVTLIVPDTDNHRIEASQLLELHAEAKLLCDEQKELWIENAIVEEMNRKHMVVRRCGKTCYGHIDADGKITYEDKQSFKNYYEADIVELSNGKKMTKAEIFIKHPLRRQYEDVIFEPTIDPVRIAQLEAQKKFNTFRGLAVKPLFNTGKKLKIWHHLFHNISSEINEHYIYMRKWFAHIFQKPHELPDTSIIIIGEQGVGKNILVQSFGRLLGQYYVQCADLSVLTNQFDAHLSEALLVLVSEAEPIGDKRLMAKIKSRITDSQQTIEPKGVDRTSIKNYARVVMCSNNDSPIFLDRDNRRFFPVRASSAPKSDLAYFAEIIAELDEEGLSILLADLLSEPLNDFNPRIMPKSMAKIELQLASADSATKYVLESLQECYFDDKLPWHHYQSVIIKKDILWECYKKWCADNHEYAMKKEIFSKTLKKVIPSTKLNKRSRDTDDGRQIWVYKLPDIESARKEFCKAFNAQYEELFKDEEE